MCASVLENHVQQDYSAPSLASVLSAGPLSSSTLEWSESAHHAAKTHPLYLTTALNMHHQATLQWKLKRFIDIFISLTGVLLMSPIWLVIAILIKLDSTGPVLFKQKRIGINGQPFNMYKFRSMHQNAEDLLGNLLHQNEGNAVMFKLMDDPRMTRVGKVLRKFSLDEFPQLLNVLEGHMSLVGPRPPVPREVKDYKPWHYVRLATLPGLTGLWQISGRSSIKSFDRVVELDFDYITNWSLFFDLKILFQTIPVVLLGKDAA